MQLIWTISRQTLYVGKINHGTNDHLLDLKGIFLFKPIESHTLKIFFSGQARPLKKKRQCFKVNTKNLKIIKKYWEKWEWFKKRGGGARVTISFLQLPLPHIVHCSSSFLPSSRSFGPNSHFCTPKIRDQLFYPSSRDRTADTVSILF